MSRHYFAYIRVSTVKQGEYGSSLIEQRSAIEAYAARNGLVVAEWFEEMETAAKQGRRAFSRMLAKLRAGSAQGLIMHKIDRGARNPRDWADLGDLIDQGVDIRFVTDNFDLTSRGGRLSADIQAVIAADYVRNLREEVKKGLYGRLKQGIYPFAAPVGYLDMGGGIPKNVDPIKGPLVRELFERYGTNTISLADLGTEFWDKGLRSRAGHPIRAQNLSVILHNPFYIGLIKIKTSGELFQGKHEPLISVALFERVQSILKKKTVPKARKHLFLLRQAVKCGDCNRRSLTGEQQKGHIYYRCHSPICRGSRAWRGDTLESLALHEIAKVRFQEGEIGDVGNMIEEYCQSSKIDQADRQASLKLRLDSIEAQIQRLTDLLIEKTIEPDDYKVRKEKLVFDRQAVLGDILRADGTPEIKQLFERFEPRNRKLLRFETLIDEEKREMLDILCSNFSIQGKEAVFALRSPYREIAESLNSTKCGPIRTDVRTRRLFRTFMKIARSTDANEPDTRPRRPHVPAGIRPRQRPAFNKASGYGRKMPS